MKAVDYSVSRRLWKRSLQDGVSRVNEKLGCRPVSFTCKALVEFMLCSWWPDQILQTVIWQAKSHQNFGGKHLPVQPWRAVYTSTQTVSKIHTTMVHIWTKISDINIYVNKFNITFAAPHLKWGSQRWKQKVSYLRSKQQAILKTYLVNKLWQS